MIVASGGIRTHDTLYSRQMLYMYMYMCYKDIKFCNECLSRCVHTCKHTYVYMYMYDDIVLVHCSKCACEYTQVLMITYMYMYIYNVHVYLHACLHV